MNDDEYKKALGEKIKSIRRSLNLTQENFCAQINLEAANLSNIENGKSYPSMPTLINIIKKFNVQPNDIFDIDYYQDVEMVKKIAFDYYSKLPIDKKIMALKIIMLINEEDKN